MNVLVHDVMAKILGDIRKHGLETELHYSQDLENDKNVLLRLGVPGAKFGWKVGHTGTHLYALGLHPKRNEHVTYVTRDSASDLFYLLEFSHDMCKIKSMSNREFEALKSTPIPYQMEGRNDSFWLLKNGKRIGHCKNEFVGTYSKPKYRSTITTMPGVSILDKEALAEHANFSIVALAGTLFIAAETVWAEDKSTAHA